MVGGWRKLLILISVQEMMVRVSEGKPQNLVLASVEWSVMIHSHVLLPVSSTNGVSYQRVWRES